MLQRYWAGQTPRTPWSTFDGVELGPPHSGTKLSPDRLAAIDRAPTTQ
jgi:hypothetical protein